VPASRACGKRNPERNMAHRGLSVAPAWPCAAVAKSVCSGLGSLLGMTRVLITGMSGTGKSTALVELARRGHQVVDADLSAWSIEVASPDGSGAEQLSAKRR
jgi:hypothetical protein